MQPHISLAAEKIGSIAGIPITNSTLLTWIVIAILAVFTFFATRNISLVPKPVQLIAEIILEGLYNLFKSIVGEKNIDRFFPLLASLFLFIVISNWSGLLPGVGSIGFKEAGEHAFKFVQSALAVESAPLDANTPAIENASGSAAGEVEHEPEVTHTKFVPLLRGPTADLNTTLALALMAVAAVQYYGLQALGIGYLTKFFNFSNPINFFLGLLELVSEASRVLSFAFRLFGNIFAGEVLLTVIAFLMPILAPLPFIGLELFVGVIQGLVFSMLTAVFLNMATVSHDGGSHH